jgi:HD-GYP domain-containing protein (c-di-GMP phosphodiesterase class II)
MKESSVFELLSQRSTECDQFEKYTHPHASRVAALAEELARSFSLGLEDRVSLKQASLAHDLGEMVMDREYIKRNGPLSDEERTDIERHPLFGEQEAARLGADRGAQLLVRWHHEWWNGAGYPDALRREQIPLAARILKVSDVFASMTDDRPYRKAFSVALAKRHLVDRAGLEFDPRVVKALLAIESHSALVSYATEEIEVTQQSSEVSIDVS